MLNTAPKDKSNFWAKDRENGRWWHITEGTGDGLSQEDIDDGYVDYIYYDYYDSLNSIEDQEAYDGGMILLKKAYQDHSLEEIVKTVQDFEDVTLDVIE